MAKVIARSKNGKMLKVGEDEKSARWYYLSLPVESYAKNNINIGDVIDIQYAQKDGNYVINRINKGTEVSDSPKPDSKSEKPYTPKTTWGKSPEEQDSIRKQAILHAVSRMLIALQGHVDPNNVGDIATSLFDRFYAKLSE